MTELFPPIAQAFLIPIAILFAGVCASRSHLQKAFISVIGLAFTVSLFKTMAEVPTGISGSDTIGLLSIFLAISWVIFGVIQLVLWGRDRRQTKNQKHP